MDQVSYFRWVHVYDLSLHFLGVALVQESLCEPTVFLFSDKVKRQAKNYHNCLFFNLEETIH